MKINSSLKCNTIYLKVDVLNCIVLSSNENPEEAVQFAQYTVAPSGGTTVAPSEHSRQPCFKHGCGRHSSWLEEKYSISTILFISLTVKWTKQRTVIFAWRQRLAPRCGPLSRELAASCSGDVVRAWSFFLFPFISVISMGDTVI